MERRTFLKNTGLLAAGLGLARSAAGWQPLPGNRLPEWKGFNLPDFYIPDPTRKRGTTTDDHFRWMRDWGFNFVRIPMAYPVYLDFDRSRHITPDDMGRFNEKKVNEIEHLVHRAHQYGLHVSLNLHRAPGYCINAGFHEPFNLWKDDAAQQAFYLHWGYWAKRFRAVPRDKISFDLVNEPAMRDDMNNQHSRVSAVPGDVYRRVAKTAAETIRAENPARIVIADGNNVGTTVIREITDLDIAQSCRGYYPGKISHYKAPWANKDTANLPVPQWPGQVGNQYLSRELLEQHYKPWIELVQQGVGVHCGECGSWNKTPHNVFLAWFGDVLDILHSHRIGFALWEFSGDFGVLNSRRADVQYENWYGQQLDRRLLDLIRKHN